MDDAWEGLRCSSDERTGQGPDPQAATSGNGAEAQFHAGNRFLKTGDQMSHTPDQVLEEMVAAPLMGAESARERSVIARVLAGDKAAFATLVRPYLGSFTKMIHRILQDPGDTERALQEALLCIRMELPCLRAGRAFRAWAYGICLDEALALRRSRGRRRGAAQEIPLQRSFHAGRADPRADARTDSCEARNFEAPCRAPSAWEAQLHLSRLPDDQRLVFVMRDLEGLDTEYVARKLGLSRRLIAQKLHQARMGLRDALTDPRRDQQVLEWMKSCMTTPPV